MEFGKIAFCSFSPMELARVTACNFIHTRNQLDEMPGCSNRRRRRRMKKARLLMSFLAMASKRSFANRATDGRINVSESADARDSPEQEITLPSDLGLTLPASLSWIWSLSSSVGDGPSPRIGCRWMGVIFELEGVIVDGDDPELGPHAWFVLCQEEGKQLPPDTVLRSMEEMKTEEAISEVLGWSEDPLELRRLAARKEDIHRHLRGCSYHLRPGAREFLSRLMDYGIPMAAVSPRPRKSLEEAIQAVGLEGYFSCTVAAEDFDKGKPDPEMFICAAEFLDLELERCIVIGNSDSTVMAAAAAGMSSVVVACNKSVYEFRLAERVVRSLDELSVAYLKSKTDPIQQRAREMHMEIDG